MKIVLALFCLTACASKPTLTHDAGGVLGDLKVTSTNGGHLRAKLALKNTTAREVTLLAVNPSAFRVETTDGKAMPFKGPRTSPAPITLRAGEAQEFAFNLQDNYSFWDRRTKYKVWFEAPEVKSNVVQVWF